MKTFRTTLLFLAVAAAVLTVAACGNKGELVKPEPKPDASAGT
jgi:predicted small lipoprotein YifL